MSSDGPIRGEQGALRRDIFGTTEVISCCVQDVERTALLAKAIAEVVRPGDRVIELGTGTGILAMLAARAGAARVDAFEIVESVAERARRNIVANGLDDRVHVHAADVVSMSKVPEAGYDVVVAEMITTGLIEEELIPAINRLIELGVVHERTRVMPCRNVTFVEVVAVDDKFHGVRLPHTIQLQESWQPDRVTAVLTTKEIIHKVDVEAAVQTGTAIESLVDQTVELVGTTTGTANALRLSSVSQLSALTKAGWTQCLNSPILIGLDHPWQVQTGVAIEVRLTCVLGGGIESLRVAPASESKRTPPRYREA